MKELTNNELKHIVGGFELTQGILNSFSRMFEIFLEVGRSLGTSIRRIGNGSICDIN